MLKSTLTGKYYDEKDAIRIINPKQASFYWHNGIKPISIYPSHDVKTGEPILVFLFYKSKTKDLYDKWLEMKPKNNDKDDNND